MCIYIVKLSSKPDRVSPGLIQSHGQAHEDHLEALDEDADEEVVEDEVELEDALDVAHEVPGPADGEDEAEVEDDGQGGEGHVHQHQPAPSVHPGIHAKPRLISKIP